MFARDFTRRRPLAKFIAPEKQSSPILHSAAAGASQTVTISARRRQDTIQKLASKARAADDDEAARLDASVWMRRSD